MRKLFLGIDFVVTNNEALKENIAYVKNHLLAGSIPEGPCPPSVQTWIGKQYRKYLIENNKIIFNRLEKDQIQRIVDIQLGILQKRLADKDAGVRGAASESLKQA